MGRIRPMTILRSPQTSSGVILKSSPKEPKRIAEIIEEKPEIEIVEDIIETKDEEIITETPEIVIEKEEQVVTEKKKGRPRLS